MIKKYGLAVIAGIFVSGLALADHSLKDAMADTTAAATNLRQGIESMVKSKGVVCDYEHSVQLKVRRITSDTWRQIALCFESEKEAAKARGQIAANKLGSYFCDTAKSDKNCYQGTYGLNVKAILDVTYDRVNYQVARLRGLTLE